MSRADARFDSPSSSPAFRRRCAALIASVVSIGALLSASAGAAVNTDWPGYLHGPAHSSTTFGDTAITPANVGSLRALWSFTAGPATLAGAPAPKFDGSPTVVGGRVYIGSRTGIFYALNAATGAVVWKKQLDVGSAALCSAKGIIATASVLPDPATGVMTVYAAGAHYLYALNANTGVQKWKVAIGPATADGNARYYNYSSPTVVGGRIYMGLSSNCDDIKIRGGVVQIDQRSGKKLKTYYAVPSGNIGPSVWTSMAGDGTSVWVTTGNPDVAATQVYDTFSIVRLSAATMIKQEKWTAPTPIPDDLDFGGSPTFFSATIGGVLTDMVGACNKNGLYYTWKRTALAAGPVWTKQVGNSGGTGVGACITAAAFDSPSKTLFVAANQTTINGVAVQGSVRGLDPATGATRWEQPLRCLPNGSPTVNSATHVVAVPMYGCLGSDKPGVSLFDGLSGAPLRTIDTVGKVFAQPVFANGKLFIADESGVLTVYGP